MPSEDIQQEFERNPLVPLRLRLSSGKVIDIPFSGTAWVRQNTVLIVHPLTAGTAAICGYDFVYLGLIERIEQIVEPSAA